MKIFVSLMDNYQIKEDEAFEKNSIFEITLNYLEKKKKFVEFQSKYNFILFYFKIFKKNINLLIKI